MNQESDDNDRRHLEKLEIDFHLMQFRQRASIRIKDSRQSTIDYIVFFLNCCQFPFDFDRVASDRSLVEQVDPAKLWPDVKFSILGLLDKINADCKIEELCKDMEPIKEFDNANAEFWNRLDAVISHFEEMKEQLLERNKDPIKVEIQQEIDIILIEGSRQELIDMKRDVEHKLDMNDRGVPVDVEYWELMLKNVEHYLNCWYIDELFRRNYSEFRERAIEDLQRLGESTTSAQDDAQETPKNNDKKHGAGQVEDLDHIAGHDPSLSPVPEPPSTQDIQRLKCFAQDDFNERLKKHRITILEGKFKPNPDYKIPDTDKQLIDIHFHDKRGRKRVDRKLEAQMESYKQVAELSVHTKDSIVAGMFDQSQQASRMFNSLAAKKLDDDEEVMATENVVDMGPTESELLQMDKFRLRKPRFYNIVYSGYDWNRYNSTHYDKANPPPKVVYGYRFNIFYPDLLEKTQAPTYKIVKDTQSEDSETCLIVFSAGPPYQDIAFRIVNKPWETSYKRGFICTFERDAIHLHFRFRRRF